MSKLTYLLCALLLSNAAYAEQSAQSVNGQLHLKKKNQSVACTTLDIQERSAAYMGNYPCKNDEVYDFKLEQAAKHSVIILGADNPRGAKDCPLDDWLFYLEVTSDTPLDTEWTSIADLKLKKTGEDVLPGLKMQKNDYDHGNIAGKLSCVNTLPPR
ncbi:TPA: hypothetical protein U8251_001367 [Pseudomonas putida]|nr:hypothetical protein [Pseudomonas putida]